MRQIRRIAGISQLAGEPTLQPAVVVTVKVMDFQIERAIG
jgi:hypothetical protein